MLGVGGGRRVVVNNVDNGHHARVFVEQNCLGKGGAIGELQNMRWLDEPPQHDRGAGNKHTHLYIYISKSEERGSYIYAPIYTKSKCVLAMSSDILWQWTTMGPMKSAMWKRTRAGVVA